MFYETRCGAIKVRQAPFHMSYETLADTSSVFITGRHWTFHLPEFRLFIFRYAGIITILCAVANTEDTHSNQVEVDAFLLHYTTLSGYTLLNAPIMTIRLISPKLFSDRFCPETLRYNVTKKGNRLPALFGNRKENCNDPLVNFPSLSFRRNKKKPFFDFGFFFFSF